MSKVNFFGLSVAKNDQSSLVSFNGSIYPILDTNNHLLLRARFPGGREVKNNVPFFFKSLISCCITSLHLGLDTAFECQVSSISVAT